MEKHFFQTKSLQSMDRMLKHVYITQIPKLLRMHLNPILLHQLPIGIAPFHGLQIGGDDTKTEDGFAYYTYGPNGSIKEFTYVNEKNVYRSYDGGSTWYDITPPQSKPQS